MGLVIATLTAYGGGIFPAILLGGPSNIVATDWAVPFMVVAWLVTSAPQVCAVLRSPLGRYIVSVGFEFTRLYVVLGGANRAHATLPPPRHYPVNTVGPLICGTLGGCGGGILPATLFAPPFWGVPFSGGLNWAMKVAGLYSLWVQFSTRDPTAKPLVAAAGLGNELHAQALGLVALAVVLPTLSVACGVEPLGPPLTKALAKAGHFG